MNIFEQNEVFLIPSQDQFLSEYVDRDKSLLYFVSGFSGSNGIAVLRKSGKNLLFTDSRYTISAKGELDMQKWEIFNMADTSITSKLKSENIVSIGLIADYFAYEKIEKMKADFNVNLMSKDDAFSHFSFAVNDNLSKVFHHDVKYSGMESVDKMAIIRSKLENRPYFISDPASICWLLNIRGKDQKTTPIVNCFAIIDEKNIYLIGNFDQNINLDVQFCKFDDIEKIVKNYAQICVTKSQINAQIMTILSRNCKVSNIVNPIEMQKAIKNTIEIENIKIAHKKDAIAMRKLLDWVRENCGNITEIDVAQKSIEFRSEDKDFVCESFDTIAGFNENGAIIHYHPTQNTNKKIEKDGILLIDSGGQYPFGTTDITRTLLLGDVEKLFPDARFCYDLVKKSLEMLSDLHFPNGTSGGQIDAIARYNLWQNGLDFAHGTGHGVGQFLSVHEGPCGISKSINAFTTPLCEGMVLSIEPGLYFEGKYGIRLENLVFVKKSHKHEGFLCFETLTRLEI